MFYQLIKKLTHPYPSLYKMEGFLKSSPEPNWRTEERFELLITYEKALQQKRI